VQIIIDHITDFFSCHSSHLSHPSPVIFDSA
jgi:hypothetical protein